MATLDNRLPTEGTQLDMEARLAAIETALASLMSNTTGGDIKDAIDDNTTAITSLAASLGTDKANRDASNITDASAWRSAIGVDNFVIENKNFDITYSSSSNPVSTAYYDISKTGYTPVGVISFAVVGVSSTITYVNACSIDPNIAGINKLYFAVRATQTGSYTHQLFATILYRKND